eukprot:jgi/Bigna1/88327/estExt_fgenesh1_pg.C_300161
MATLSFLLLACWLVNGPKAMGFPCRHNEASMGRGRVAAFPPRSLSSWTPTTTRAFRTPRSPIPTHIYRTQRPVRLHRGMFILRSSEDESSGKAPSSLVDQLAQLKALMDAGALTQEEFEKAKARVLGGNGEGGGSGSEPKRESSDSSPPSQTLEEGVAALADPDAAKNLGRLAGKVFKERVREWSQFAEEASTVAPAALRAAQKVAAPRIANAAEEVAASTSDSLENLGRYSSAIAKIVERKTDSALNQAESYRNAAASVVKNRANRVVLNAIGVDSSEGALAWAAELEKKAENLENFASTPDRALSSIFNKGGDKPTSEEDAAKIMAAEAVQVDAIAETAAAAEAASAAAEAIKAGEMPDVWAPAIDEASGRTYYWNYLTRETTWEKPDRGAVVLQEVIEQPK